MASAPRRPRKTKLASAARAEKATAGLFFDEAESLFGKRTTVSDSHDRFAAPATSRAAGERTVKAKKRTK